MYTLRTIETDGREVNLYLGNHYTIMKKESFTDEHFDFELKKFFGEDFKKSIDLELVKAFIDAQHLPNSLPIYWDRQHYIVTESGKTFQKL